MNDAGAGLTYGRVSSLVRLCAVLSMLLVGAAIALQFAPLERPPSPSDLASATSRQGNFGDDELFPVFSAKLGARDNPFRFEQLNRAQVRFQQVAQDPAETSAPRVEPSPPPVPQPNVDGLSLVGTVPGSRHGFALFLDQQSGEVQTIAIGEPVRNAVLSQVHSDRVELTLADQRAELSLARLTEEIPGAAGNQATAAASAAPAQQRPAIRQQRRDNKPSLGLSGYMLSPADAQRLGVSNGLLITGVRRSDGLVQIDDVIVKMDGRDFASTREVVSMIKGKSAGEQIELTLMRQSKAVNVTILL